NQSRTFSWLSTKPHVLGDKSEWYFTPTVSHADLTALASLPPTEITMNTTLDRASREPNGTVTLENTGKALAFQVRLKAVDASGNEILPVYWQENYIELMPGEQRTIAVAWPAGAPEMAT